MLPGSLGIKRNPYMDNRRKDATNCLETGDGRGRSHKDYPGRDISEPPDEEINHQLFEG